MEKKWIEFSLWNGEWLFAVLCIKLKFYLFNGWVCKFSHFSFFPFSFPFGCIPLSFASAFYLCISEIMMKTVYKRSNIAALQKWYTLVSRTLFHQAQVISGRHWWWLFEDHFSFVVSVYYCSWTLNNNSTLEFSALFHLTEWDLFPFFRLVVFVIFVSKIYSVVFVWYKCIQKVVFSFSFAPIYPSYQFSLWITHHHLSKPKWKTRTNTQRLWREKRIILKSVW